MSDQRCLITVVGERNEVDLAVPARAPIAEYADLLARLCGQHTDDALPPAWSLAPVGAGPLPVTSSLAEAGVADGQTLYLRDTLGDEADEPVVRSVWEIVTGAGTDGRQRWTTRARGRTAVLVGAGWLVAALAALGLGGHGGLGLGVLSAALGVALAVTARLLRPHNRVLTRLPRLLLGCAAVPCLALTGLLSLGVPAADPTHLGFLLIGAVLGLGVALVCVPDVVVAAVAVLVALAGAVFLAVVLAGGTAAAAAGSTVAVGTLFLAVAPRIAAMLTAASWLSLSSPTVEPDADPDRLAGRLDRAHQALVLLTTVTSAAVAVGLVVLSRSAAPFPLALAGVAVLALLIRSGSYEFAAEAVPVVVAASAGGFALLTVLGGRAVTAPFEAPALLVAGIAAVAVGLPVVLWRTRPAGAERPRWLGLVGTICQIALVALLLGVYGVFAALWHLGTSL